MLSLGLIVLIMVATAATVVSAAAISTATIVAAAVLALVRTDSLGPVGAANIISAVITATIVATSATAAGLTLIRASAIYSLLTTSITAGLALIGSATSRAVGTGISIFGSVATGLTTILRRAFFLRVVAGRESHLGR